MSFAVALNLPEELARADETLIYTYIYEEVQKYVFAISRAILFHGRSRSKMRNLIMQ